jgi:DNA-binding MarR family transcriptional regulator
MTRYRHGDFVKLDDKNVRRLLQDLLVFASNIQEVTALLVGNEGSIASLAASYGISPPPELGEIAKWLYKSRQRRALHLDADLLGEPGWDILLDIYTQGIDGKQVSITSACTGANVPSTTALRWLTVLEGRGLIVRWDDPNDKRRAFVNLTPAGRDLLESVLVDFSQTLRLTTTRRPPS